jgi:hypothetical protein
VTSRRVFPPRRCRFLFSLQTVLLLWLALSHLNAAAQAVAAAPKLPKPYALIYGTVWGPDHRPLYGVPVEIRRVGQKKPRWSLTSDHSGEFAQRVPAGRAEYTVSADLKHFKYLDGKHLRVQQAVTVQIENDERADIGLHLME